MQRKPFITNGQLLVMGGKVFLEGIWRPTAANISTFTDV